MNKFYEVANIISVFFFMPVLIFLSYHAKSNSKEVVIEQPPLQIVRPNIQPLPSRPELPVPDEGLDTPVPELPSPGVRPQPLPQPQPQPQPQPHRGGLLRPKQPRSGCGSGCPSYSYSLYDY